MVFIKFIYVGLWPDPTWCLLNWGLETMSCSLHAPANDAHVQKEGNDWTSKETIAPDLNRKHIRSGFSFVHAPPHCSPRMEPLIILAERTHFGSDPATMSRRASVWMMCIGNYRGVVRSINTFQSRVPFTSVMLGVIWVFRTTQHLMKSMAGFWLPFSNDKTLIFFILTILELTIN